MCPTIYMGSISYWYRLIITKQGRKSIRTRMYPIIYMGSISYW